MFIVYEIEIKAKGTGQQKKINFILNSSNEDILSQTQYKIINYKILFLETIYENINPSILNTEENLEILTMLKENVLQNSRDTEIIQDLKDTEQKRLVVLAPIFSAKLKEGINIPKILQELKFPRYIHSSLEKASGTANLAGTYSNLIKILESDMETSRKIGKLLRYPKIVFGGLIFYFLFIELYLVPKNNVLLSSLSVKKQPPFVEWIYSTSSFAVENNYFFIFITIFLAIFFYKVLYFIVSKLITYVPAVNKIVIFRDSSLFFNILSMLLEAGIDMNRAIRNSVGLISEKKMKENFIDISKRMKKDAGSIFNYIKEDKYKFSPLIKKYTKMGEKSADFGTNYRKLHEKFEEQMFDQIDLTLELINPLTMLITVVIMIGLYVGVQYPLLNLSTSNF